jgi:hypothetical protein
MCGAQAGPSGVRRRPVLARHFFRSLGRCAAQRNPPRPAALRLRVPAAQPPSIDGDKPASCGLDCKAPEALQSKVLATQGTFAYQSLSDEWSICQHIRDYGES